MQRIDQLTLSDSAIQKIVEKLWGRQCHHISSSSQCQPSEIRCSAHWQSYALSAVLTFALMWVDGASSFIIIDLLRRLEAENYCGTSLYSRHAAAIYCSHSCVCRPDGRLVKGCRAAAAPRCCCSPSVHRQRANIRLHHRIALTECNHRISLIRLTNYFAFLQ